MSTSDLEAAFTTRLRQIAPELPAPVAEYQFAPPRRWRFDFCWPVQRVAVELEGGVWSGGRHTRPAGFEADVIKYNTATVEGWRVLRCTSKMLCDDPAAFIALLADALEMTI
jgi:very-short-patch-repair endonuclease